MTPQTRRRIERLVDALLDILDQHDGDHDLEDGHDAEHDPAEWGVSDSGADQEYAEQLWFKRAFEQHRHEQRDKAARAIVTRSAD